MEKRFVVFLVVSFAFVVVYTALVNKFAPPPEPDPIAEKAQPDEKDPKKNGDSPDKPAVKPPDEKPEPETPEPEPQPRSAAEQKQKWVSLGSYSDQGRYRLLATFNSHGATLERVELTERNSSGKLRYRNLEETHGYLGHLALTTEPKGGARVNVVGDGTPAAVAGVKPDDVLMKVDGEEIRRASDLDDWLVKTKPGQKVKIELIRATGTDSETVTCTATLGTLPLEIIRPEPTTSPTDVYPLSLRLTLAKLADKLADSNADELANLPSLLKGQWEVLPSSNPDEVAFRHVLDAATVKKFGVATDLEIIKRFRIATAPADAQPDSPQTAYHFDVSIELRNAGKSPIELAYRLEGPNGLPLEGWWYTTKIHPGFAAAGARDVLWRIKGHSRQLRGTKEIFAEAKKTPASPSRTLLNANPTPDDRKVQYAGVDAQYFNATLIAGSPDNPADFACQELVSYPLGDYVAHEQRLQTVNTTFRLTSEPVTLDAGQSHTDQFTLFVGPKLPAVLDRYQLGDAIEYGWFAPVAKMLSGILHFFQRAVRNYGLAIIMLTVLVRGCMFPVSRKAAQNAQMMQELAPEMKAIKEKYKNDMQKQSEAQRQLFAKHNYNPFSGCLLVFLQLPIFIGLYRAISTDIELRQASLIPGLGWASNLAGPDMLFRWDGWLWSYLSSETGWLGPYFNVLPCINISLFLVQQKLFMPPATDEQTQMQQTMMKWMTMFMGVLFFKVPSGLCIYFIASSIWSICERKFFLKTPVPAAAATASKPVKESRPARIERKRKR